MRMYTLVTKSVGGRLYLAALHAATNSSVPDNMLGISGEEMAIEIVRVIVPNI